MCLSFLWAVGVKWQPSRSSLPLPASLQTSYSFFLLSLLPSFVSFFFLSFCFLFFSSKLFHYSSLFFLPSFHFLTYSLSLFLSFFFLFMFLSLFAFCFFLFLPFFFFYFFFVLFSSLLYFLNYRLANLSLVCSSKRPLKQLDITRCKWELKVTWEFGFIGREILVIKWC